MKLHIITCDAFRGWFPSADHPYRTFFSRVRPALSFEVHDAVDGVLPAQLIPGDIYLIGGSRRGVYEKEPWIERLLDWIRAAHAQGASLAGICFGHQALCHALGGRVERVPKQWIGVRRSSVVDPRLRSRIAALGEQADAGHLTLLYHHHDQAVRLPPAARVLASSRFCPCEAFALGDTVIGFQGHPEFTVGLLRFLLGQPAADFSESQKSRALAGLDACGATEYLADSFAAAEMILGLAR